MIDQPGTRVIAGRLEGRGAPLVCGHRGAAATHPENTLAAFEAALAAGCDAVELDVRLTADSRLAVIHDPTVDRTTDGTGPVAALTAAELRRLDAGGWRGAAFAGQRVPLLEEVLELCRGRALVLVELKPDAGDQPETPDAVARAVHACGAAGCSALLAFDHRHLARARDRAPWLARIALCAEVPPAPAELLAGLGAEALAPPWTAVDAALCATVHAAGARVVAWTVDHPRDAVALATAGVDVVITNDPVRVAPGLRGRLEA